ncbi:MAG TPA: hypothetical protein DCP38_11965 [Acidobacteria bacterium]|nr:hypothetical protein [Acidobacteriota bacterium]HAK56178.1 hypothetical protein [Acidobacteriota bacterium]
MITYDPTEIQQAYVERQGLQFPMLSDVGSEVIKRYGILNETVAPDSRVYGIPHPGTFILDPDGRVVDRFFEQGYQQRNTVSSIAVKLGNPLSGTGVDGTRLSTDHLEAVVYPTDEAVAPGNRVSVVLDVTPKAEMHLYAPGSHAYQVILLRVDAQEGLVVHPVIYPESEIYHFEPLDERVEVYQQPFRIIQDVTIPITPETRERAQSGGTITVDGVFEYQACDDAICYNPVSLPVSWTLQLRPMVTD